MILIYRGNLTINPNKSYRFKDLQGITLYAVVDFFRFASATSLITRYRAIALLPFLWTVRTLIMWSGSWSGTRCSFWVLHIFS